MCLRTMTTRHRLERIAEDLVGHMHAFQKHEGTTAMCTANALYLCDALKHNGGECRVEARIAVYGSLQDLYVTCHVVAVHGEKLYDPSYEVGHNESVEYIKTVRELSERVHKTDCDAISSADKDKLVRYVTEQHISLMKVADKINDGQFVLPRNGGREYYHRQADYCERMM